MAGALNTEMLSGIPGGHPPEPDSSSKQRAVMGARERLKEHRRRARARRGELSKEARRRVSEKIEHLIETGEVPNTEEGQKKAAGMAYGMARAGRLRRGGVYVPVHKEK